jgi:hypothetical protein
MNLSDLLTPWLMLAAVIIPLVYVEKWIHSHLYGVGWLLTNDKKSATALYYVLLFPGVLVHEFTQYLVAGALNVKIKRVIAWPKAQNDGTLRLDFVQIQEANRFQTAVIGAAPLITGLALVWVISSQVLNLDNVIEALGTTNLSAIGEAMQDAARAPDFLLWLYVIFTISNAMLPTPADRQGWPLLIGLFGVVVGFLVLIGVGDVLMETFTGPVAHGVERITIAFATVLIAEVPGILTIGFVEEILEKTTKRKFQYDSPQTARRRSSRQPGSNLPLPSGAPLPSIYNLNLPIPSPSDVKAPPKRTRREPAADRPSLEPPGTEPVPRPRPAFEPAAPGAERAPRPIQESPPGSARPDTSFPRRRPPEGEEHPPARDERQPLRPPGSARPDTSFPRRRPPEGEEHPPARDERQPLRPPGSAQPDTSFPRRRPPEGGEQPPARDERQPLRPPGSARPDTSFPRRPSAAEDQPPPTDRFARPQPARPMSRPSGMPPADDTTTEEDEWLSGFRSRRRSDRPVAASDSTADRFTRPQPGSPTPLRREEDAAQTPGARWRPASPFDRRPSPFEDDEDDEDISYENFDDEDGVLDNVYDDDDDF